MQHNALVVTATHSVYNWFYRANTWRVDLLVWRCFERDTKFIDKQYQTRWNNIKKWWLGNDTRMYTYLTANIDGFPRKSNFIPYTG